MSEENKPINGITHKDVEDFQRVRDFTREDLDTLGKYQQIATKSAIYPGIGTPLGLAYCALKLNGEAGEFAEHVGKAMRDDNLIPLDSKGGTVARLDQELKSERYVSLLKEAGDVLWYLSAIANELGVPLSFIAQKNLEKLADRTERNKLQGSGDDR